MARMEPERSITIIGARGASAETVALGRDARRAAIPTRRKNGGGREKPDSRQVQHAPSARRRDQSLRRSCASSHSFTGNPPPYPVSDPPAPMIR